MKRYLFLVISFFLSLSLSADEISPSRALELASEFAAQRIAQARGAGSSNAKQSIVKAVGRVNGLYLFSVGDKDGFMVVSNDDCTSPILGYADSGTLNIENMPDNMKAWLQGYADEIAWAKEHGIRNTKAAASYMSPQHHAIKQAIAPLIESRWNQSAPYNNLCPEYTSGVKSVTGCVATAMAQVMFYHQWPAATIADIPGYTTGSYGIEVGSIPAGTTLDWNNMLPIYNFGYSNSQATAVAQLMSCCGVSVKMNYGQSSGAYTTDIAGALKNYFGYKETVTFRDRNQYTYGDWINIIYHELSEGRPVLYAGSSSGGGHEFVCDGYEGEDYFHINWGWGGISDSYFKLSALDPDQQGIGGSSSNDGYYYGQTIVIGVQEPSDNGTILEIEPTSFDLSIESVTFSDNPTQGEEVEVRMAFVNNSDRDFDGDIRMIVVSPAGKSDDVTKVFQIGGQETEVCKFSFIPNYAGEYEITVIVPSPDAGYMRFYNLLSPYTVEVAEGETSTTNDIPLTLTHNIENANTGETGFYTNKLKASVTFRNDQDNNFNGNTVVYVYHKETQNIINYVIKTLFIKAHSSETLSIESTDLNYGDNYRVSYYYTRPNGNIYGHSDYMTCSYGIVCYDEDGSETFSKPAASYTVPAGATAVNLSKTGVTSVTPSSNPNCIYIFDSNDVVPTGLNNVIKGNNDSYQAAAITLTDNQEFYSPVNFTASNIEFTYAFTTAADGTNGWNTLVLPFDVAQVTANSVAIDWFHSSTDTGKNFWVKEFYSDDIGTVYFNHASAMKANTPYIVAFPGSKWGEEWSLAGKTIKFKGRNATVSKSDSRSPVAGSFYRFIGNTIYDTTKNIYTINDRGNSFVLNTSGGSSPFRAFFKPGIFDRTTNMLTIGDSTDKTTTIGGIPITTTTENSTSIITNLQGQRVSAPRKGLYIINGKKVMVK